MTFTPLFYFITTQEAFVSTGGDLEYSIDLLLVSYDGENGKKIKVFEKGVTIWKKDNLGKLENGC